MLLVVFIFGSLIIFVEKTESVGSQDRIEDFIPLLFPKVFLFYEKSLNGSNSHARPNEYFNLTKGNSNKVPDGYVKGYSIKIPKHKLLEKGYPKMNEIEQEARTKRGVLHLYNMVSCATGCNPLKYKGYGCFCGFLGSGYPVDGIDRCCKTHDWCYDGANCPMYFEYFVPYYWKCWYNRPLCAIHHGEYGGPGSCADKLCECDRALSECLKQYQCPSRRAFCKSSPLRFLQNAFMLFI